MAWIPAFLCLSALACIVLYPLLAISSQCSRAEEAREQTGPWPVPTDPVEEWRNA
jgi:hypothetical protein